MTHAHQAPILGATDPRNAPHPTVYTAPRATPTAVVIHQPDPLVVTHWPSTVTHVLRVLAVLLGILHALTCFVFLYVVYSVYRALAELQAALQQLSSGWGLGG